MLFRFLKEIITDDIKLLEGVNVLENWDLSNNKDSEGAVLALQTFKITYDVNDFEYDCPTFSIQIDYPLELNMRHCGILE